MSEQGIVTFDQILRVPKPGEAPKKKRHPTPDLSDPSYDPNEVFTYTLEEARATGNAPDNPKYLRDDIEYGNEFMSAEVEKTLLSIHRDENGLYDPQLPKDWDEEDEERIKRNVAIVFNRMKRAKVHYDYDGLQRFMIEKAHVPVGHPISKDMLKHPTRVFREWSDLQGWFKSFGFEIEDHAPEPSFFQENVGAEDDVFVEIKRVEFLLNNNQFVEGTSHGLSERLRFLKEAHDKGATLIDTPHYRFVHWYLQRSPRSMEIAKSYIGYDDRAHKPTGVYVHEVDTESPIHEEYLPNDHRRSIQNPHSAPWADLKNKKPDEELFEPIRQEMGRGARAYRDILKHGVEIDEYTRRQLISGELFKTDFNDYTNNDNSFNEKLITGLKKKYSRLKASDKSANNNYEYIDPGFIEINEDVATAGKIGNHGTGEASGYVDDPELVRIQEEKLRKVDAMAKKQEMKEIGEIRKMAEKHNDALLEGKAKEERDIEDLMNQMGVPQTEMESESENYDKSNGDDMISKSPSEDNKKNDVVDAKPNTEVKENVNFSSHMIEVSKLAKRMADEGKSKDEIREAVREYLESKGINYPELDENQDLSLSGNEKSAKVGGKYGSVDGDDLDHKNLVDDKQAIEKPSGPTTQRSGSESFGLSHPSFFKMMMFDTIGRGLKNIGSLAANAANKRDQNKRREGLINKMVESHVEGISRNGIRLQEALNRVQHGLNHSGEPANESEMASNLRDVNERADDLNSSMKRAQDVVDTENGFSEKHRKSIHDQLESTSKMVEKEVNEMSPEDREKFGQSIQDLMKRINDLIKKIFSRDNNLSPSI